jgi:hypothetical protein
MGPPRGEIWLCKFSLQGMGLRVMTDEGHILNFPFTPKALTFWGVEYLSPFDVTERDYVRLDGL